MVALQRWRRPFESDGTAWFFDVATLTPARTDLGHGHAKSPKRIETLGMLQVHNSLRLPPHRPRDLPGVHRGSSCFDVIVKTDRDESTDDATLRQPCDEFTSLAKRSWSCGSGRRRSGGDRQTARHRTSRVNYCHSYT